MTAHFSNVVFDSSGTYISGIPTPASLSVLNCVSPFLSLIYFPIKGLVWQQKFLCSSQAEVTHNLKEIFILLDLQLPLREVDWEKLSELFYRIGEDSLPHIIGNI